MELVSSSMPMVEIGKDSLEMENFKLNFNNNWEKKNLFKLKKLVLRSKLWIFLKAYLFLL